MTKLVRMTYDDTSRRDHAASALGVVLVHALVGYALIAGFGVELPQRVSDSLKLFTAPAVPPPPPEKINPQHKRTAKRAGAAAPPNLKADPTEIVAPPKIAPAPPPPVAAAPIAGTDTASDSGAAPYRGPGTGAGGQGFGRGNGGYGDGPGGGGGGSPPHQTKGRIKDSDYPHGAADAGISGMVWVRYHINMKGRVDDCEVTRSSGSRELDDTTCRLITERFRFKPGTDDRGRPVGANIEENHEWLARSLDDPDNPDSGDDRRDDR